MKHKKKNSPVKIVKAEQFQLVNKKGEARLLLALGKDGTPRLALMDHKGKLRASLYIEDGQVGFELLDSKETVRAAIGLGKTGQPSVSLLDKEQRVHAVLEMVGTEAAGLDFYDKKGALRASLGLYSEKGLPKLALIDQSGRRRHLPPAMEEGSPVLALFDKDGEICAMVAPEDEDIE